MDDNEAADAKVEGIVWWQGPVECDLCGHGKDGRVRSVVPIPEGDEYPIVPLECSRCGNMTMHPVEDYERSDG